jgi:NAD(P)-dependent dehydrogenase (short-subunit alcohol dehydrogenase family)
MSGPVMVITSALAGIGRTTALAAAGQGCKIVLSGRNSQTGAALEAELRALGAQAG